MILAALKCGPLIPPSYREPVRSVPVLAVPSTAGDMAASLDGQTARLDQSNGRTADVIALVEACDARTAEVTKALQPRRKFLGIF